SSLRGVGDGSHRHEGSRLRVWWEVQGPVASRTGAVGDMRLYLDEDTASALLPSLLRNAGHDVQVPADVGLSSRHDAAQLLHSIREDRVFLSRNYRDFENLHLLVLGSSGHHPGIMVVRRDDDPRRNLSPRDVVRAIRNLIAAGVPIADEYHIQNHWR